MAALMDAWDFVDSSDLGLLQNVTARLADRRVVARMTTVALAGRRPQKVRLAALAVLVRLADPSAYVRYPKAAAPGRVLIGDLSHYSQELGDEPLTLSDRRAIVTALEGVAKRADGEEVRAVAATLATQLEARLASK